MGEGGADERVGLMRKSKLKIPGYEDVEFEEYSGTISPSEDPEEFLKRLRQEEAHDTRLDSVALEIAKVAEKAIRENRAVLFWDVGDRLLPFQNRARTDRKELPPFEWMEQVLQRVSEKEQDLLRGVRGIRKKSYGVPYLRKMLRVREKFRREQLEGIPYPEVQELIHDYLTAEDREFFLARVKDRTISSAAKLRGEVRDLKLRRSGRSAFP